jgi:hypothetical protein
MKKIRPYIITGLACGLFFLGTNAWNDIFGTSRFSNYYDWYNGSMSYKYFKITFRPVGTGHAKAENISLPILHYGYNLANNEILKANILQSEIPKSDLRNIFYDTTQFQILSPDSIYLGWISLRGNFFSFPFSNEYGFELTNYKAYKGEDSEIKKYETLRNWKQPFTWYAWASLLLPITFMTALLCLIAIPELEGKQLFIPFLILILYLIPACYIAFMDYEEDGWPVIISICTGILFATCIWMLYRWKANIYWGW